MPPTICVRCGKREATVGTVVVEVPSQGNAASESRSDISDARWCEACATAVVDDDLGPGTFAHLLEQSRRFDAFRATLTELPLQVQQQRIREYVQADLARLQREAQSAQRKEADDIDRDPTA